MIVGRGVSRCPWLRGRSSTILAAQRYRKKDSKGIYDEKTENEFSKNRGSDPTGGCC